MTTNETKSIRAAFADKFSYTHRDWKPERYDDEITTNFERIMILADLHAPRHNVEFLADALQVAYAQDIQQIIWLGDALDNAEFSTYGVDDRTSGFQRNCTYLGEIIHDFAERGFYQIYSSGNHEARLWRATKNQLEMESLAYMCGLKDLMDSGDLIVSQNPTVLGSVGNWLFTHPAVFGAPGTTPAKLAERFQKNVVTAHEHAFNLGRDSSDKFWTVSCGGLFQKEMHRYVEHNMTAHRSWVNGFCTIIDGMPKLYHPEDFR
jgi:hypothetical protein